METQWVIQTRGDPLRAVRRFLAGLWTHAALEAMVVPMRPPDGDTVIPLLVRERARLDRADPFAPCMACGMAALVARLTGETPRGRLGAVVRPCEANALAAMPGQSSLRRERLLLIGVECLGTYSREDFEWRSHLAGGMDALTREALRFTRQGGILTYRYRRACQMCASPVAEGVDLTIGVLGLLAQKHILITARDEAVADALLLEEITDGVAPRPLIAQHRQMVAGVAGRRSRGRDRFAHALPPTLPADLVALMAHLEACAPCRECLDACPVYSGGQWPGGVRSELTADVLSRWLAACSGCGLCEDACPKDLPLTAITARVRERMNASREGALRGMKFGS